MSRAATLSGDLGASARAPRLQAPVVLVAGAALALGAVWLAAQYGLRHGALLLVGAGLGLTLYHAAFGFTWGYRVFVSLGDSRGIRAQLLAFAIATVLFAPVLARGSAFGEPVGGALAPASVSVLVGAFIFAIGMQLGGGCGSGTLYHIGAGATPMLVTFVSFVAGSVLATFHAPFWAAAPSLGEVSLAERYGWPGAVLLQLGVLGLLALAAWWVERRRRGTAAHPPPAPFAWRRVLHGPWSLVAGAVVLALLNLATLLLAGHPWTITWAFTLWGGKALTVTGVDLAAVPFWSGGFQRAALAAPVLADVTSVMDIGLVLGALLGAGLAGRWAPAGRIPLGRVAAGVIGGLLLGYGARIAFGCNIGALFSGVASTSLHGWMWGVAALLGTPIGVRLRPYFGLDR